MREYPSPFIILSQAMRLECLQIFGCALVLISGCGSSKQDDQAANGEVIKLCEAHSELVLAKIGEYPVTCGDFRARQNFELGVWKFRNSHKKIDANAEANFVQKRMPKIIPELLNQRGIKAWMEFKGIEFTAEDVQVAETAGLRALGFRGNVRDFAEKVGCPPDYASVQLCAASRFKKAAQVTFPDAGVVTEQEVDEGLKRQDDYYERAIASNRVTWATCSNVIEKIEKGLPFEKASLEYAYSDPEEGEKWEDTFVSSIEDVKLKEWVSIANIGEMSIFELDDGISIVKVLEKSDGETVRAGVVEKDIDIVLARINFAMVEPEPEPRTRDYVRAELKRWKLANAQKKLGEMIMVKFPISYPNENAKIEL